MIKKINVEKIIFICIMILLISSPIIKCFFYTCYCLNLFNLYRIEEVNLLWYGMPVLFVLYILDIVFYKKKINYVDILIYLLIALGILSTIFAIDVHTSIYGEYGRNEGLLSLLSYYFILLNLKNMTNENYKYLIVQSMIIIGLFQVLYGVFQVYTQFAFIKHFQISYMASALCGNPNFFGSYMVLLTSLVFAMYLFERKIKYLVLAGVFFFGLCLASSTGPFLSFLLIIILFIIWYRKSIKWKSLLKVLLTFILVYVFVDFSVRFIHRNVFNNNIKSDYNISLELKNLKLSNIGNGRIKLWQDSLPLLKKHWLVGIGLDNFGRAYGLKNGVYYDKVHNVYLQIAITNGIYALIIYLTLMTMVIINRKRIKGCIYISLFMAFIGYSIQAFANISVVEVAPYYFIIWGLLLDRIEKKKIEKSIT